MAYVISDDCISCGTCEGECPAGAISEGDPIYIIDPDNCTECVGHYDEPACVAVCPVDCIKLYPDNQETMEELKFKFKHLQSKN